MKSAVKKILLVDDEPKFLDSIAERLKLLGFDPLKAASGSQALEIAESVPVDMVIVDLKMPGMDGLATIARLKEIRPGLRSVLLTGFGGEKIKQATEAIHSAYFEKDHMQDFWAFIRKVNKDGNTIVISPPSDYGAEGDRADDAGGFFRTGKIEIISGLQAKKGGPPAYAAAGNHAADDTQAPPRMIGETLAMQQLKRNIDRLASLDCTVTIRGETGSGKELTARIIHSLGHRKNRRFIAFNCGCFTHDLLFEEFFKSGEAVFSDDSSPKRYDVETGNGGTILLDQIEDMPAKMQLSMLKILDSSKTFRQGEAGHLPFDVRILFASRHNIGNLAAQGKLREELYHRINLMELVIPPLRERRDDIPLLAGYFLNKYAKDFNKPVEAISDEVISVFMAYDFPGNVRELEHLIERAVILADDRTIETRHLPARFQSSEVSAPNMKGIMTLAEMERRHILNTLEATGGNKSKAAELLGISRSALWRKLSAFSGR